MARAAQAYRRASASKTAERDGLLSATRADSEDDDKANIGSMHSLCSDVSDLLCGGCRRWIATHFASDGDKTVYVARPRQPGSRSPLLAGRAAFEGAGCEFVAIRRPRAWPGAGAGGCEAALMHDEEHLWLCYDIQGGTFSVPSEARVAQAACAAANADAGTDGFEWCREQGMAKEFWSILGDDRVELFMWVVDQSAAAGGADNSSDSGSDAAALARERGQSYFAIECNRTGGAIQARVGFRKQFDWSWRAHHRSAFLPAAGAGAGAGAATGSMVLAVPWKSFGLSERPSGGDASSSSPRLRIALCRGERGDAGAGAGAGADPSATDVGEQGSEDGGIQIWSSWIDPEVSHPTVIARALRCCVTSRHCCVLTSSVLPRPLAHF